MGCILSQPPKVSPQLGYRGINSNNNEILDQSIKFNEPDPLAHHSEDYHIITFDVHSLKCPPGMVPIVCLDSSSFPITSSVLNLEDTQPTEIRLPIAAASITENGRLFCISHINFL